MFEKIAGLKSKIISLILFVIIFYLCKPSITFKPSGKVREYGVGFDNDGYKKTFYTFNTIILIACILIYMYD
jgi:hypothetical protein